jgi:hypothetical protein
MALTKGNREKVTSVSSIQSRMGVVDAYAGDPVSMAADAIGKSINVYAERMITIQDENYKSDFKINTIKKIGDFAKQFNLDPEGFTNATNAYIEGIVSKAPKRFKNWSKEFASLKAAQEGDVIFNKKYNNDQIDAIKLNNATDAMFIDDNLRKIIGMNQSEFDDFWSTSLLPELGEIINSSTNLYNSLDPQFRSGLPLPEEKMRKYKLAFEGARVNSSIQDLLSAAVEQDRIDYLEGNIPYGTGDTTLEKAVKEIKTNLLKDYVKNPESLNENKFAVLTNSTTEERQEISESANTFIESFVNQQEKLQKKIENQQQVNIDENHKQFMGNMQNYLLPNSLQQLNIMTDRMGFSVEQKSELTKQYNTSTVIESYGKKKTLNLETDIGSAYRLLTDDFGYDDIKIEDVKKMMIDYKVIELINDDYVAEEGMPSQRNLSTIDFSYDISNDIASNDLIKISAFASRNGVVPSEVNEFINSATGLNYETEADRMQLAEIAYTVNYLTSRAGFAIDGLDQDLVLPLMDLHEQIKRMPNNGVTEKTAYEYFFSKINKDSSIRDEIDLKIDNVFENEDIDLDGLILDSIEEEQSRFVGVHSNAEIGITTDDFMVEPLIDWFPLRWLKVNSSDLKQKDVDMVKSEIMPLFKLYLNNTYLRPEEVNKYNINKHIKNAIKLSFTTLGDKGYGVE